MDMAVQSSIPVEFFYDEESRNWGFVVESPSVVGGGDPTIEEAMRHAAEAIVFALEGEEPEVQEGTATRRLEYLPVSVG